ncbi:MAG: non-canonical purine NTP pyrophosphatase [Bacteriovoracaceae bacterium]|nr:non-canonical purine NTP pyrophosphatase [Bacteriovoracaceae bacterium]
MIESNKQIPPKLKIMVATTNAGKRAEISDFFKTADLSVEIDFCQEDLKVDESGSTFAQNAYLKACAYAEYYKNGLAVCADDSGLVLADFPELLGVQTSRFHVELPTYQERANILLAKFREHKISNPVATFYCVLCLRVGPAETYFFTGKVRGTLASEWREGGGGFGYDGLFIPEGKSQTFSEDPSLKLAFSHRQKAMEELLKFLRPIYSLGGSLGPHKGRAINLH